MKLRACLVFQALLALAMPVAANLETSDEIQDCVSRNQRHDSSVGTIVLKSVDRIGTTTESRAKVHWKRFDGGLSRVLIEFTNPPDLRNSAILMIEQPGDDDMFMYMPELGRVRRVTGRMVTGSMFGTDFTYEQFQSMQGMTDDLSRERLPDAEEQGRAVFVLAHRPNEATSQFEKVVSYIDKETCVPLRTEYFERGDALRKVLTSKVTEVEQVKDAWIPRQMVMKDLRDETQTTLLVEDIRVDVKIPKKIFSQGNLAKGH